MRKQLRRRKMTRLIKSYDFPWMPAGKMGDDIIAEAIGLVESAGSRLDLRRAAEDDLEGIVASSAPAARWAAVEDELVMRYAGFSDDRQTIRDNFAMILAESDDDQHTLAMSAKNSLGDDPPRTAIPWLRLIIKVLRVLFDMLDDAMKGPSRAHIVDSDVEDDAIDAEFTVNEPPIFSSEMKEAPGTTFTMEGEDDTVQPPAPESEVEPSVPDPADEAQPMTNNQVWGGDTDA